MTTSAPNRTDVFFASGGVSLAPPPHTLSSVNLMLTSVGSRPGPLARPAA